MVHLVYCDNAGKAGQRVLDKILAGEKIMVVRGAAGRKIPHSRVFPGETLYFMEKGSGRITAKAAVKDVQNYVKLGEEEIGRVLAENGAKLALTEKQQARWHKKCLCLVEFEGVQAVSYTHLSASRGPLPSIPNLSCATSPCPPWTCPCRRRW